MSCKKLDKHIKFVNYEKFSKTGIMVESELKLFLALKKNRNVYIIIIKK